MGKEKKQTDNIAELKKKLAAAEAARDKFKEQAFQLDQIFQHTVPHCMTDKDFNIIRTNADYPKFFNKKPDASYPLFFDLIVSFF